MSEAKVRSFFDRYAAAFSALDVKGILDHFALMGIVDFDE